MLLPTGTLAIVFCPLLQVSFKYIFLWPDGPNPSPSEPVSGPYLAAFSHMEPAAGCTGSAHLGDGGQLGGGPAEGGRPGSLAGTQTLAQDRGDRWAD